MRETGRYGKIVLFAQDFLVHWHDVQKINLGVPFLCKIMAFVEQKSHAIQETINSTKP